MNVFILETRGKEKPIYWLLERPVPEEGRALVNIYSCSSRIWAQNQIKDKMVSVYNSNRGDKYWDFRGQEQIDFEYWLTIDVDAESNCYYIRSGYESLPEDQKYFKTVENRFSLYSTTFISHLPELIEFAVLLASYQGVHITFDGLDESYV